MYDADIAQMSDTERQSVFVNRFNSEIQFAINSIAAVLSNDETSAAFKSGLAAVAPTLELPSGIEMKSYNKISYKLPPIEQRLNLSVSGTANVPTGTCLNLISFNGSEWGGLLPQASKIYKLLPLGLLLTPITQALFGTKAGPALLLLLLAL
ncbi:MAG TPA: hypothetical protein PKO33_01030 [Pyrinomonadaceae bacterium]|nr:hypothetical protein [Pyrinomonadaceae bacterium]